MDYLYSPLQLNRHVFTWEQCAYAYPISKSDTACMITNAVLREDNLYH